MSGNGNLVAREAARVLELVAVLVRALQGDGEECAAVLGVVFNHAGRDVAVTLLFEITGSPECPFPK